MHRLPLPAHEHVQSVIEAIGGDVASPVGCLHRLFPDGEEMGARPVESVAGAPRDLKLAIGGSKFVATPGDLGEGKGDGLRRRARQMLFRQHDQAPVFSAGMFMRLTNRFALASR